jgi:hypothetical protein
MYQRIDSVDWSFVLGKEVEQICIGPHDVQVHMFGDVSLFLESGFEHNTGNQRSLWNGSEPAKAVTLVDLIGHSANKVSADGDRALIIEFSNGHILTIFTNGSGYESFSATAPGIDIVF